MFDNRFIRVLTACNLANCVRTTYARLVDSISATSTPKALDLLPPSYT